MLNMSRFPRFFTLRAMLLELKTMASLQADGTRPQSIRQVFSLRSPQAEATISRVVIG